MLSPVKFPPFILMSWFASNAILPLRDTIPAFIVPELLLLIFFSDFTIIFPFPTIFPLLFVKLSVSIVISPPAFIIEVPPDPWFFEILILDSLDRYICGVKTLVPLISTSTYHIISLSKLLIWFGVKGFPISNPKDSPSDIALSSKVFICIFVRVPV